MYKNVDPKCVYVDAMTETGGTLLKSAYIWGTWVPQSVQCI